MASQWLARGSQTNLSSSLHIPKSDLLLQELLLLHPYLLIFILQLRVQSIHIERRHHAMLLPHFPHFSALPLATPMFVFPFLLLNLWLRVAALVQLLRPQVLPSIPQHVPRQSFGIFRRVHRDPRGAQQLRLLHRG